MIYCKELNKEFETKAEMIKAVVENKSLIIASKTSQIKHADCFEVSFNEVGDETKARGENPENLIYPVINTTNFMDSHGDVHGKGIWNKSVNEQQGNIYYAMDHKLEVDSIIAFPKNVKLMLQDYNWSDLGYNLSGNTQALVYEVKLTGKEPNSFKRALKEGNLQNSVRMQYVKIELAVNDEEYEAEYKTWLNRVGEVANIEQANEVGYFWYVSEAKISKEGSAVLFGSNSATPILQYKSAIMEPTKVTPEINKGVDNKKSNYYYTLHNV